MKLEKSSLELSCNYRKAIKTLLQEDLEKSVNILSLFARSNTNIYIEFLVHKWSTKNLKPIAHI